MFTPQLDESPYPTPPLTPTHRPAPLAAAGQYQAQGLEGRGLGPETIAPAAGCDRPVEPGAVWVGQQAVRGWGLTGRKRAADS